MPLNRTVGTGVQPATVKEQTTDRGSTNFLTDPHRRRQGYSRRIRGEDVSVDSDDLGSTDVQSAIEEVNSKVVAESLWDRDGTTLEPQNVGDGIEVEDATLGAGATVDEFSTDSTMAGDSDTAVPTEHAVKTYTDTQLAAKSHGTLQNLQVDDHDNVYDRVVGRDGSIATKAALDIAYPAGVAYRNYTAYITGGAGARDRVYRCLKNDSDTYIWTEVVNGGL